jgi:phosphatidylglycerophosphate synthase
MPDRKPRHGVEVLCEFVFRPVAGVVARALVPLRVPPPAVVLAAAATGGAAVAAIVRRDLVLAAVLLQAKTVLDNADGQLARLTGRVTAFGRYLDSLSDLVIDAAVFAALGLLIGPWLAVAGFVLLTAVLSVNFNVERLYRQAHGAPAGAPDHSLLGRVYAVVYGPQDRLLDALAKDRPPAWHDARTVGVVANFGLSTQLAVLGVCLALGHPAAYVAVLAGCALVLIALFVRRERLARRVSTSVTAPAS